MVNIERGHEIPHDARSIGLIDSCIPPVTAPRNDLRNETRRKLANKRLTAVFLKCLAAEDSVCWRWRIVGPAPLGHALDSARRLVLRSARRNLFDHENQLLENSLE